jgi:hypothetical protein
MQNFPRKSALYSKIQHIKPVFFVLERKMLQMKEKTVLVWHTIPYCMLKNMTQVSKRKQSQAF